MGSADGGRHHDRRARGGIPRIKEEQRQMGSVTEIPAFVLYIERQPPEPPEVSVYATLFEAETSLRIYMELLIDVGDEPIDLDDLVGDDLLAKLHYYGETARIYECSSRFRSVELTPFARNVEAASVAVSAQQGA
jgi:hypothetical protein